MPVAHPLAPFRRGVSRVLRRRPRPQMQWIGCTDFLSLPSRDGTPPYTSRVAPTSYRKKIPQITCRTCTVHVRVLGRRAILRHAHGYAYAAGGRRVSTSTYPRRKRCRHPRPHCALEASASSDPGTLYDTAGSITSHRPSSDPPSYSERFDARLLRSVHRSHDQRNTQAAPSQSGSPSLRDVFA